MDNGDGAERNEVGKERRFLRRDDDAGALVSLETNHFYKFGIEVMRTRDAEHVLSSSVSLMLV